ncbi:dephospho-CoA kinase [Fervidicella metallireducens AeB]|uniref:Dephospho-CoA kinase n=1 Tax=Fervidicella metallireducens AeB TaxID=1403537 RepID=A0A017RWR1_9CLOT|nr:dephospho-CoA kinase [Fervidicella metallireducens]EYE89213.1 dephospho-CoA kinase [Fervidicella metallireducens AeB]
MKVIGLTGGIASGKSTISNILKTEFHIDIIDADLIAREIVKKGSDILDKIAEEFGNEVINSDGSLNRKKLGEIVFSDEYSLNKLNKITHPVIEKHIKYEIDLKDKSGKKLCVVDAALLIEAGFYKLVDYVVLVCVNKETQLKRLMQRDKISEKEAFKRINSQMPLSDKVKYADFIIDNNGDLENVKLQTRKIIKDIMGLEEFSFEEGS